MPTRWATLTPAQLERKRELDRLKKRAKRAKFYALGLSCYGRPPKKNAAARRIFTLHPAGCLCYDCLYPTPKTSAPTIKECRVLG